MITAHNGHPGKINVPIINIKEIAGQRNTILGDGIYSS
jgi:hypothetical protein